MMAALIYPDRSQTSGATSHYLIGAVLPLGKLGLVVVGVRSIGQTALETQGVPAHDRWTSTKCDGEIGWVQPG